MRDTTKGTGKTAAKRAVPRRTYTGAPGDEITTLRVRRSTRDTLDQRRQELGAASLDEALATVLFRQKSYEVIARLNGDPEALAEYQHEAHEIAEAGVEVVE